MMIRGGWGWNGCGNGLSAAIPRSIREASLLWFHALGSYIRLDLKKKKSLLMKRSVNKSLIKSHYLGTHPGLLTPLNGNLNLLTSGFRFFPYCGLDVSAYLSKALERPSHPSSSNLRCLLSVRNHRTIALI